LEKIMKKIGVIVNLQKTHARSGLRRLLELARHWDLTLTTTPEVAALSDPPLESTLAQDWETIEALVVLGGDGTLLRAVREFDGRDKPILGVNLGSLGFLTSVTESELAHAVEAIARNTVSVSERTMLSGTILRDSPEVTHCRALNDIVIRSTGGRVITLGMSVGGREVSHFVGDGLIVATPTGSSGYALSAGGPIVMPDAAVLLVALMCPHTLSTRPLVLPDTSEVIVRLVNSSNEVLLISDGQRGEPLTPGDRVVVTKSPRGIRFLHVPGYDYFAVLRQKLHWRGTALE
jgi:NAD+ kinase